MSSNYAAKSDIDTIFGKDSIEKWADLNNKGIPAEIKARIDWALQLSHTNLEARLRDGPYAIPFTTPIDPLIVDLEARMAGVLLYDGRRIADNEDKEHAPDMHRDMIDHNIKMLLAGQLRLEDLATSTPTYPQAIVE